MEDPRISQQDVAQPLSGTELLPVVQKSVNTGRYRTLRSDINALKDFLVDDFIGKLYPAGAIIPYASNIVDDTMGNWLLCDGRSLSQATYPKLFRAIGVTYGSVDSSSFNIPDLKGRCIIGYCDVLPTQVFDFGKWNSTNAVAVGSINGASSYNINQSNLPVSHTAVPTNANLVQDVNVSCAVDGSDFLIFSDNKLSVKHRNWQQIQNINVNQQSYNSATGQTINSNANTKFGAGGGTLPFNIVQTTNVQLINKKGRSAITLTDLPTAANNYTTTVLVNDDGPSGRAGQSFTLRYSASLDTQMAYVSNSTSTVACNITQPYMALNYIIKY
jgi:microcystin-dependent protein